MLLLLSRAARRRKSFQERTRYKTLIFFFFWIWTFVRLVKISSRSTFPPLSLFVVRFFCSSSLLPPFSASFCFFFSSLTSSSSQVTFHTTNRERESIIYTHPKRWWCILVLRGLPQRWWSRTPRYVNVFLLFQILSLRFRCRRLRRRRLSRLHDRFFVWGRYFLDRTRALLEPRDESARSSSSSSSLRSSLNHVVLFFARERESLRFKEEEDGARECISIKISFTNLLSYVNTRIFLKI